MEEMRDPAARLPQVGTERLHVKSEMLLEADSPSLAEYVDMGFTRVNVACWYFHFEYVSLIKKLQNTSTQNPDTLLLENPLLFFAGFIASQCLLSKMKKKIGQRKEEKSKLQHRLAFASLFLQCCTTILQTVHNQGSK